MHQPRRQPAPTSPPRPSLRVFDGEHQPDQPERSGLSPQMTLSEFFAHVRRYQLATRRDRYLDSLKGAVDRWVEYTGDPPLEEIDQDVCATFAAALKSRTWRGRPIGKRTRARFCRETQILLDLAAPRDRHNPRAVLDGGLFGVDQFGYPRSAPWLEKPRLGKLRAKPGYTLAELEAILDGCSAATVPGSDPPQWWWQLFVWEWNVGTRIGTTLAIEWS